MSTWPQSITPASPNRQRYTGPIFDADTHFGKTDNAWTAYLPETVKKGVWGEPVRQSRIKQTAFMWMHGYSKRPVIETLSSSSSGTS